MAADFLSAILITLVAAAPEAATKTVKSIDAQGTVNYALRSAEPVGVIPDRISVIGPDPYFAKAAEDLRRREALRAEYEEREWQRRQQALLYMQSVPTFAAYDPYPASWSSYPGSYYYPTYGVPVYGAFVGRSVRPVHPIAHPPHVSHHSSHSGGMRSGGRSR